MLDRLTQIFNDADSRVRSKLFGIYGVPMGWSAQVRPVSWPVAS